LARSIGVLIKPGRAGVVHESGQWAPASINPLSADEQLLGLASHGPDTQPGAVHVIAAPKR
jgi:hypothetical protein